MQVASITTTVLAPHRIRCRRWPAATKQQLIKFPCWCIKNIFFQFSPLSFLNSTQNNKLSIRISETSDEVFFFCVESKLLLHSFSYGAKRSTFTFCSASLLITVSCYWITEKYFCLPSTLPPQLARWLCCLLEICLRSAVYWKWQWQGELFSWGFSIYVSKILNQFAFLLPFFINLFYCCHKNGRKMNCSESSGKKKIETSKK